MLVKIPRGWEIPESQVTPESVYFNRRQILESFAAAGLIGTQAGCGLSVVGDPVGSLDGLGSPYDAFFPVARNEAFDVPERPLTDPYAATHYNNFYEFTVAKSQVWQLVGNFEIEPWTVEIGGLCNNPGTYGVEELMNTFDMEERIYRHRCVETWAMTVPWSGFPFARLIEMADPTSNARFVRMVSENRPAEMPGIDARPDYPWPYFEALRLEEAMNELAFLTTGLYGLGLPRQNGAPLRLAVPWKYGYKSIKSIVRIEFTADQPATFWNTINPEEYSFLSNVDPDVPHPRWSQASEWLIPDMDEEVPTMKYNGYSDYVADLYE